MNNELPWADSDDWLFTNKQSKASTGRSSEPVRIVPVVCFYEWEFWKAAVCKSWCCLSSDAHGVGGELQLRAWLPYLVIVSAPWTVDPCPPLGQNWHPLANRYTSLEMCYVTNFYQPKAKDVTRYRLRPIGGISPTFCNRVSDVPLNVFSTCLDLWLYSAYYQTSWTCFHVGTWNLGWLNFLFSRARKLKFEFRTSF